MIYQHLHQRKIRNFSDQPPLEDNHPVGKPKITPASLHDNQTIMVLQILSVLLHPMNSHNTEGLVYLTDTRRIQIHTPQHLNPHPMGGNRPLWNPRIPEAKLIPLLTLQTDMTMVTKMTTPNQAAQMNPEDLEALTDQESLEALVDLVALVVLEVPMVPEAPEVQADLATILPMSKTSCRNL